MKKKLFALTILILSITSVFSQNYTPAELQIRAQQALQYVSQGTQTKENSSPYQSLPEIPSSEKNEAPIPNHFPAKVVLNRIEDMKSYISTHPGEKEARSYDMQTLYDILEKQTYSASSKDGQLYFDVKDYDTKNQCWPVEVKFSFENSGELWSVNCNLLYSDVLVKTFISDKQMTERQRNEYQFNVNYYDQLIRENQILYAELTYRIKHWKMAGEYRFEPISLKIYKFEKNTQKIFSADSHNLEKSFFYIIPAIDIRNDNEKLLDEMRVQQIVSYEENEERRLASYNSDTGSNNPAAPQKKAKPIQHRRNSIYFTASNVEPDFLFSAFQANSPVNEVQADLTFGINKFMFAGLQANYDLSSINAAPVFTAGGEFGFNVNLGRFVRPFAEGVISYTSDNNMMMKAGGGLDFIFSLFMINITYSYNWKFDIQSAIAKTVTPLDMLKTPSQNMNFSLGLGFTW